MHVRYQGFFRCYFLCCRGDSIDCASMYVVLAGWLGFRVLMDWTGQSFRLCMFRVYLLYL